MNTKLPIFRFRKMESNFRKGHESLVYQLFYEKVKPQIVGQIWPKNLDF